MKSFTSFFFIVLAVGVVFSHVGWADSFDLRDVNGVDYVTSVKSQTSGTCWTHGTMAAIEGNLLMTGVWEDLRYRTQPNLSEYHLDWWNGFNQHNNDDMTPPTGGGLEVHMGGDYRVVQAYVSRGEGAVYSEEANDGTQYDTPWYDTAPARSDPNYAIFYPRDIEWYTMAEDLTGIEAIKEAIRTHGVLGTCMCWDGAFYNSSMQTHYQPIISQKEPNHSIAIVGWDDSKWTQGPWPGAWLCKNSWGTGWSGGDEGYFWISYYDKHCGRHPEMGAVSFQNVEPLQYDSIYYHDYHGWRDTMTDCNEAFNAFVADANETIIAASFITAVDDVNYTVTIFDGFEDGQLVDELVSAEGHVDRTGFHTIDLPEPVDVLVGDDFYVYLNLSAGGQAYDCTSEIPVLLLDPPVGPDPEFTAESWVGAEFWTLYKGFLGGMGTVVESTAAPGQSYYYGTNAWVDLQEFDVTANFCIKALAVDEYVVEDPNDSDDNG